VKSYLLLGRRFLWRRRPGDVFVAKNPGKMPAPPGVSISQWTRIQLPQDKRLRRSTLLRPTKCRSVLRSCARGLTGMPLARTTKHLEIPA